MKINQKFLEVIMLRKRQISYLIITSLLTSISLTGCGEDAPTVNTVSPGQVSQTELTKIIDRLDVISTKIDKLEKANTGSGTPTTTTTNPPVKPDDSKTTTSGSTPASSNTTTPPAKTTTDTDPKVKGRKILDMVINNIKNAEGIEADVSKYEKSLTDGHTVSLTLKLYSNKAAQVRIDVIKSTSGDDGVKILYTSGVGDKVKVRPAGVLSLVTTDLSKKDDRITSANSYTADDTDFYGMARRFSQPVYEAELIGTSKINNEPVYVLNVTCKGTNTLDTRIKYEHISFEPKTFKIRSWEAYTSTDKDAFYKFDLMAIKFLTTVPESNLKI
jgi:hypothetical protein